MTKPIARDPMYRRRRSFDADIIELCVRWYITYRLSYRDIVAMMAERGVEVSHTTILRWVVRYVPEFEKRSAAAAHCMRLARRMRAEPFVYNGLRFAWDKHRLQILHGPMIASAGGRSLPPAVVTKGRTSSLV